MKSPISVASITLVFLAWSGTGYAQTKRAVPSTPAAKVVASSVAPIVAKRTPKRFLTREEATRLFRFHAANKTDIAALRKKVIPEGLSLETSGGYVKAPAGTSFRGVVTDQFVSNNTVVGLAATVVNPNGVASNAILKGRLQHVPQMMGNFTVGRDQSASKGMRYVSPSGERTYWLENSSGGNFYDQRGNVVTGPKGQGQPGSGGGVLTPEEEARIRTQLFGPGQSDNTGYAGNTEDDAKAREERRKEEERKKKEEEERKKKEAAAAAAAKDDDDDDEEVDADCEQPDCAEEDNAGIGMPGGFETNCIGIDCFTGRLSSDLRGTTVSFFSKNDQITFGVESTDGPTGPLMRTWQCSDLGPEDVWGGPGPGVPITRNAGSIGDRAAIGSTNITSEAASMGSPFGDPTSGTGGVCPGGGDPSPQMP